MGIALPRQHEGCEPACLRAGQRAFARPMKDVENIYLFFLNILLKCFLHMEIMVTTPPQQQMPYHSLCQPKPGADEVRMRSNLQGLVPNRCNFGHSHCWCLRCRKRARGFLQVPAGLGVSGGGGEPCCTGVPLAPAVSHVLSRRPAWGGRQHHARRRVAVLEASQTSPCAKKCWQGMREVRKL